MTYRVATALAVLCFALGGCNKPGSGSGIAAGDRLKWYFTFVPPNLEIEKFYESPSPAMDHYYLWKIRITDDEDYRKFEAQITGNAINRDGAGVDTGLITDDYPKWWKNENLEKMEGYKFTGNENGNVYAMFDREAGILFLQVHT
jgi:hypothetical protein